jgi:flagellar hook protein FlgE
VYANSLSGSGTSSIGIGTSLSAVQQQYSQGNLTTTNNPLDIAINGGGFFRMSNDGAISYTRNGQFHLDKNGDIINDSGLHLTGYPVDSTGTVVPATPTNLQLSSNPIPPLATGQSTGSGFKGVSASLTLDSRDPVPTAPWVNPTGTTAPSTATYNRSTALTIYDTLGNPHTMSMYFVRSTPTAAEAAAVPPITGAWDVHFQIDGTSATNVTVGGVAGGSQRLAFDSNGVLRTPMPVTAANFSINLGTPDGADADSFSDSGVAFDLGRTNNAGATLSFGLDFTGTVQYGANFAANSPTQDGYTSGRLTSVNIGADGTVLGNYSNGQSRTLAQVVLANFRNPNGLTAIGDNQFLETSESGAAAVGAPNSGSLGVLQSSAVEESNVDLTAELVQMITQQRNYQASAQSIKTQDSIMQTLVNLR